MEHTVSKGERRRSFPKVIMRRPVLIGTALIVVAVAAFVVFLLSGKDKKIQKQNPPEASNAALYESIAHTGDVSFAPSVEVAQQIDYFISEAWILRSAAKPAEALKILKEAEKLAKNGPYPQLYSALGDHYLAGGDTQAAKDYYQKALSSVDTSALPDKPSYKKLYQDQLNAL